MDVSKLNSKTLNTLIRLTKRKDNLQKELEKIDTQLGAIFGKNSDSLPKLRGPKKTAVRSTGRRKRRGALKEQVFAHLKQVGKTGISIKDLAEKIKIKPQNLHVWFSTTGRNFPQITRAGKGLYRLK